MKLIRILIVTIALLMAITANAGSYKLKYESKGQVSLVLIDRSRGPELSFQVLPLTGDHSPGAALVRLDGQPVWFTTGGGYRGSIVIPENGHIPVLNNDDLKQFGQSQPNAQPIKVDEDWFLHEHQIEVFFYANDSRGRPSKNHSAAPATQFRIEREAPFTAAVTNGGAPLSSNQLDAAIRQSYEQGVEDTRKTEAQNLEELHRQLKKATDENNELRRKLALGSSGGGGSQNSDSVMVERYIPFGLDKADPPKVNDMMVIVDRNTGRFIAEAKVVQVLGGYVWTNSKLTPLNMDFGSIKLVRKTRTEKN